MIELPDIMTLPADRQVRKKNMVLEIAVMEVALNLMVYKMKDHVLKKTSCSNKEFISWMRKRNGEQKYLLWYHEEVDVKKSVPKMCWERYFQQRLLGCFTCMADWSAVQVKKYQWFLWEVLMSLWDFLCCSTNPCSPPCALLCSSKGKCGK